MTVLSDFHFYPGQHVHFVGIGGTGLSAIAKVLLERGCIISGSDRATNAQTDALADSGVTIYTGHAAEQISGADVVIISSAIYDNPEVVAAQQSAIPVYKRRDILPALLRDRDVIAVAGTAGKTTTTALITHVLRSCGIDAGYIVGATMGSTGTNATNGSHPAFVIEADEYDHMFWGLYPKIAVVTNVGYDHPDFFKTEADLTAAFDKFVSQIDRDDGALIVCGDDPGAAALLERHRMVLFHSGVHLPTYGLEKGVTYQAVEIRPQPDGSTYFQVTHNQQLIGEVILALPGLHNVRNSLAAIVVAHRFYDLPFEKIAAALQTFTGTARRFEVLGEQNGVIVIDDYAHHPAKIRATLQAARSRYPSHTIWAVWQPHTYSRTQALLDDFAASFADADQVIVTEIYAAREAPITGIDGLSTAQALKARHPKVTFSPDFDHTLQLLEQVNSSGVIVVMSAGDATRIGRDYLARNAVLKDEQKA
jgi:UDP-N-acetylmuramate--alanine ligase